MQDRIGQKYKVEYSTDCGKTRHFLQNVDPFERSDGGVQKWVHIPGVTGRVNLQKKQKHITDSHGAIFSAFVTQARDDKWRLYATLVSAPSDGAASAST